MQALQVRMLPALGFQSSGIFGDAKTSSSIHLSSKEVSRLALGVTRATYGFPGSDGSMMNQAPPQNFPPPASPLPPPPQGVGGGFPGSDGSMMNRAPPQNYPPPPQRAGGFPGSDGSMMNQAPPQNYPPPASPMPPPPQGAGGTYGFPGSDGSMVNQQAPPQYYPPPAPPQGYGSPGSDGSMMNRAPPQNYPPPASPMPPPPQGGGANYGFPGSDGSMMNQAPPQNYPPSMPPPPQGFAGATYGVPGANQSMMSQAPPQNFSPPPSPMPSPPQEQSAPQPPTFPSFSSPLPTRPLESRPKFRSKSNLSGSLGLNFPGSQIPGLPGSPRPKPGTPRPYDPTKQKSKVMEWLTPPKPPTELLQREHFKLSETCSCTIFFGDLSKWTVDGKSDAVIAPANKKLNTGPAVNAVLFKAAGSKMLECTQRLPDVAPQGIKADMGDAISTRAFDLPVARVIHTVGSVYKKDDNGVRTSDALLEKAYRTALMVARKEKLKYLAFPPLSCNIYGYPYADGAEVALRTLKASCDGFLQIDIVIRNIEGYDAFIEEAHKVLEPVKEKKTLKIKLGEDGSVMSGTVVGTTNALPNSPYAAALQQRLDPSLPPAAAEKAAAMAAARQAEADAAAAAAAAAQNLPPGATNYVPPPQPAPESVVIPPRERASPIPPTGPPPTPPSTPTMSYPRPQYQQ